MDGLLDRVGHFLFLDKACRLELRSISVKECDPVDAVLWFRNLDLCPHFVIRQFKHCLSIDIVNGQVSRFIEMI